LVFFVLLHLLLNKNVFEELQQSLDENLYQMKPK